MTPVHCSVEHNPPKTYGDCVRACVATVMDLDTDDVPHFAHDDPSGEVLRQRIIDYLAPEGYAPFFSHYEGAATFETIMSIMAGNNPASVYILFGATNHGDHVVVCRGGGIVHDPNWIRSPMTQCGSHGYWTAMVIGVA